MKNSLLQPCLRFSDFSNDWCEVHLSQLGTTINGLTYSPSNIDDKGLLVLRSSNVQEGQLAFEDNVYVNTSVDEHHKTQLNDILICVRNGSRRLIGKCALVSISNLNSTHGAFMSVFRGDYNRFVYQLFQTDKYYRQVNADLGATINSINGKNLLAYKFRIPSDAEQQKIVDFLSSVDKKINLLKEKYILLERYKKGMVQKLFSQNIRFKDENGNDFPDWKNTKFEKVFERITQKNKENNQNVLTISAQRGLINQQKYFNKSVSAKDVTGYYLIENCDFAYNKSYSKGYPMGAIKRLNNYDKGVVSTLYICFKSHSNQHDAFWEQYFEAGLLNREVSKIAQEGARNHGLLNVSVVEFFRDITVLEPSKNEQIRIADFLGTLDKKLRFVSQQIEQTQIFKKGLLQQMFV
jgi:type I restriction enzyme S subunit